MQKKKIKKQLELHLFLKKAQNYRISIKALKKNEKIYSYRIAKTFLKEYTTKLSTKNVKFPLNFTFCNDKAMLYSGKPNLIITEQIIVNKDNLQKLNFVEEKTAAMLKTYTK